MYVPEEFRITEQEALGFIEEEPFGTLISNGQSRPMATHLPFVVEREHEELVLSSHWARKNPQWEGMKGEELLAVFSGPNAYISPSHYKARESVPTWDYVAVHAYGWIETIEDEKDVRALLERMIQRFEPAYSEQWEKLSERYKSSLIPGLLAFRLHVNELQGQAKLSQEKSQQERERIVGSLAESEHPAERLLASYMKQKGLG